MKGMNRQQTIGFWFGIGVGMGGVLGMTLDALATGGGLRMTLDVLLPGMFIGMILGALVGVLAARKL